jgi:hypothetical protein
VVEDRLKAGGAATELIEDAAVRRLDRTPYRASCWQLPAEVTIIEAENLKGRKRPMETIDRRRLLGGVIARWSNALSRLAAEGLALKRGTP